MLSRVVLIFSVLLLASVSSQKILGERTRSNFPKPWNIGAVVNSDVTLTFILALKQRNLDILEKTFWEVSTPGSPAYRDFKTIQQILDIVAPLQSDVDVVYGWLSDAGIKEWSVKNMGDALQVRTNVGVARKLFDTEFHYFVNQNTGQRIIRQLGKFSLPASVSHLIDFVSGLSEFPIPRYTLKPTSPLSAVTIAPQSVQTIYKIPATEKVTGNSSIGVIEFEEQYFDPSDLQNFESQFNMPTNIPTAVHTVGTNDPSSPQLEATLDIEYVLGIGQNAVGWFWIENDGVWLYGWATHFFSTKDVPLICSISYGWNEEAQCQAGIGSIECSQLGVDSKGYVQRVNIEFQKIGLRGISILASSGDSGANGRTDPQCTETHLNPVYPASSPFITSVGGTQITDASGQANLPNPPPGCSGESCASGGDETCVSFSQASYASGGGFSDVAQAPSYQIDAVKAYLSSGIQLPPASYFNGAGRGFPDVSALGSAILIYQDGIETVGGTSASCPIWAGIIALLNQYVIAKTGKPLGFLNPFLYEMYAADPSTFHDITVGDNTCTEGGCSATCKGYKATKGWDPVSGLGSPVYSNIKSYVMTHFEIEE